MFLFRRRGNIIFLIPLTTVCNALAPVSLSKAKSAILSIKVSSKTLNFSLSSNIVTSYNSSIRIKLVILVFPKGNPPVIIIRSPVSRFSFSRAYFLDATIISSVES